MKETKCRKKALLSQKYLALLFYTNIPPQRCKEYQSLCYKVFKKNRLPPPGNIDPEMPNCLYITQDGQQGYLQLTDYKTKKTHGDDYIPLIKSSPLVEHLGEHIADFREHLVNDKEHRHLFVVRINLILNITYVRMYIMSHIRMYTSPHMQHRLKEATHLLRTRGEAISREYSNTILGTR